MTEDINDILHRPLQILQLPSGFAGKARLMGYDTLKDILDTAPAELFGKAGFSHVWFGQLCRFLVERGMIGHLQPFKEKTSN